MSDIPQEVLIDILLRLQPKDLIRCMCVSKAWYAFIHEKNFIKAHLERSIKTNSARTILLGPYRFKYAFFVLSFDQDEMYGTALKIGHPDPVAITDIRGHSNGLLFSATSYGTDLALWNPSIQKFKKIPCSPFEPQRSSTCMKPISKSHNYGFGYDSASDDYKIVDIVEFWDENREDFWSCQVCVYRLKSNSWKRIQNMPCSFFQVYSDDSVFLNGALNWLTDYMILTLDLATEKYREFSTPFNEDDIGNVTLDLEVLGGYLCICVNHGWSRDDVWIMKEYGVTESWTLLYSIKLGHMCRPLVFSKTGEMVLLYINYEEHNELCWYDLEKKSFKRVEIFGLPRLCNAISSICWGSLCLLDGDPVITGMQHQLPSTSNNKRKRQ